MSLRARVGRHTNEGGRQCQNWADDQQTVTDLLNRMAVNNGGAAGSLNARIRQGICGDDLYAAIVRFEARHFPKQRNGFVEPGGAMLKRLEELAKQNANVVDVGTIFVRSEQAKRDFLDKCNLAGGILQESQLVFTAWLSKISISYGRAFESHAKMVEVVNKIRETEDLAAEVLLTLALTFVAGGVGGLVGGAMKAAKASDFMVDGIKDLSKFAVKGIGGAEIGVFANKGKGIQISGMPVSPLEWQNSVNARVTSEMAVVAKSINEWRTAVMNDDGRFDSTFDPAVEVDKALVRKPDQGKAVRLKELPPLDDDAMLNLQHQFEQGWFSGWIPQAKFAGERSFTYPNGNYNGRELTRNVLLSYGHGIDFDDTNALVDKYCPPIEKPFPPR